MCATALASTSPSATVVAPPRRSASLHVAARAGAPAASNASDNTTTTRVPTPSGTSAQTMPVVPPRRTASLAQNTAPLAPASTASTMTSTASATSPRIPPKAVLSPPHSPKRMRACACARLSRIVRSCTSRTCKHVRSRDADVRASTLLSCVCSEDASEHANDPYGAIPGDAVRASVCEFDADAIIAGDVQRGIARTLCM
jgi:hypothetical protein